MPKKNYKISTRFDAEGNMSKRVDKMSKGMSKLARMTHVAKRSMKAAAKAAAFFGRVVAKVAKTTIKLFSAGVLGLVGGITLLARSFSKIEDAQAAFTPLMGSVKGATDLVNALNKTAATTPFQFDTLSDTAMQLLPSMNGNIERTIELTRMLGDTAGGNAQKMESITRGYNKALIKGKVDLEALNMIAEAGVPIFQELGKETGKTGKKLFKDISAGRVSVEDLTNTFKTMTTKGGIFFNGMEIASQTLTGKISTLKDNISLAAAEIGSAMAPVLKDMTDEAIKVAKSIGAWAKENKPLIASKFKEYMTAARDLLVDTYKWFKKNSPAIKEFFGDVKALAGHLMDTAKWLYQNKELVIGFAAVVAGFKATSMVMAFGAMDAAALPVLATLGAIVVTLAAIESAKKQSQKTDKAVGGFAKGLDQERIKGMSIEQRDLSAQFLRDEIKRRESTKKGVASFLTGRTAENEKVIAESRRSLDALNVANRQERAFGRQLPDTADAEMSALAGGGRGGGGDQSMFGADGPQVQSSSTSKTETKNVTLTIKNDSGNRVESDGADFEGFDMVTTGGF